MITTDSKKEERLGMKNYSNQGYLMKIVEYNNCHNIVIEFQDEQKCKKKTSWYDFINGTVKTHVCMKKGLDKPNIIIKDV